MQHLNLQELQPYILCIIGLSFILYALFKKTKTKNLIDTGERVEGIIFDLGSKDNLLGSTGDYTSNVYDKITVRFVTKKQEWITADLKSEFTLYYTGQYKTGDKVSVIYNPNNPNEFIIETKQSETKARIIGVGTGFLFLVIGLIQIILNFFS